MVTPTIEFPLILKKPGNPYEWVPLHNANGSLTIPSFEASEYLCLFTFNGDDYNLIHVGPDTSLFTFQRLPYTHWFTKPIDARHRMDNHICPILMSEGVEYLVRIKEKWHFLSTESLLRDHIPITDWFDETELFPIR